MKKIIILILFLGFFVGCKTVSNSNCYHPVSGKYLFINGC